MSRRPGANVRGGAQNARVFNRDRWICVYCGFDGATPRTFMFLEADHLDPATKTNDDYDPEHDVEKVTACISCNKLKGSYLPIGATRQDKIVDATRRIAEGRRRQEEWFNINFHVGEEVF
jgi:5-methylcytosine-specific restriction endonuclease McrA